MFLFTPNPEQSLARKIALQARLKLGRLEIRNFSDGEFYLRAKELIRGKKVYLLGDNFSRPTDLLKFLILANALKVNGAKKIIALVPYLAYARQDKIDQPGAPLTAKLIADLIAAVGINELVTINLHSHRDEQFFKIKLKNIDALPLLTSYFKTHFNRPISQLVVVSPDLGGQERARRFARLIHCPNVAILKKFRPKPNAVKILTIDQPQLIKDKSCLIVDDLIDTAGTIIAATKLLKKHQARDLYIAAVHPVLSGPAINRLKTSAIKKIFLTDTLPLTKEKVISKIKIISSASLMARNLS